MEKRIKAVIFDMDGVIIDSLPFHYSTLKKLFAEHGIKYSFSDYIKNDITAGAMNVIPRVLREHKGRKEIRKIVKKRRIDFRKLLKQKNEMASGQKIKLFPGVLPLLKSLKRDGYRLAVASGGTKFFVHRILRKNSILKYFDAVVTGEDNVRRKPHPDIFLKAAKKLHVPAKNCLVIEDSRDGVLAAKRAKMKVVGHRQKKYMQDLSKADRVVGSMGKINLKVIKEL